VPLLELAAAVLEAAPGAGSADEASAAWKSSSKGSIQMRAGGGGTHSTWRTSNLAKMVTDVGGSDCDCTAAVTASLPDVTSRARIDCTHKRDSDCADQQRIRYKLTMRPMQRSAANGAEDYT